MVLPRATAVREDRAAVVVPAATRAMAGVVSNVAPAKRPAQQSSVLPFDFVVKTRNMEKTQCDGPGASYITRDANPPCKGCSDQVCGPFGLCYISNN